MIIEKRVNVELTPGDLFHIVSSYVRAHPEAVKVMLQLHPYKEDCEFPENCIRFPCPTLSCNADYLSNGNPIHQS